MADLDPVPEFLRPEPRATRMNPAGFPPEPPPSLSGLVRTRKLPAFSTYRLGEVDPATGWCLYSRWVRNQTGTGVPAFFERWAKCPEGVQAILAQKRWWRHHSPAALKARSRRAEMQSAHRAKERESDIRQRFQVRPVRQTPKSANMDGWPVDPRLLPPRPVMASKWGGRARPWLWDPEFRPHWLLFLRLRAQCPSEEEYQRSVVPLIRPHAEAALARYRVLAAEMGSRPHQDPTVTPKRRRMRADRVFDPGTLATPERNLWPAVKRDTNRREDRENHRRGDRPADPAPAQVAVGDPEGRPAGA